MRGTIYVELETFSAVAMHRSFVAAANALNVTPASISQTVRSLEKRLGYVLFDRTTRRVALTEEGERLLRRVRPALDELRLATLLSVGPAATRREKLRLSLSSFAAHLVVKPILADFMALWPTIDIETIVDDDPRDVFSGRVDAGIRYGVRVGIEFTAIPVTPSVRVAVLGAPSYFRRSGTPKDPEDLLRHNCIRFRLSDATLFRWVFESSGKRLTIDVDGSLIVDSIDLLFQSALDGVGLIYSHPDCHERSVKDGKLIEVLAAFHPDPTSYVLYYHSSDTISPALEAFLGFLRARLLP